MGWRDWVRGAEIEPSLYAADFARLGEQIRMLLDAGARVFHFDIGDGHFVPPVTIGPVVLRSIAPLVHDAGGALDCHLMVDNPTRHFGELAQSGAGSVTFHVEAVDDPGPVIAQARGLGMEVGIAFKPETPVERAAEAARDVDLALCMSIDPGYSGQEFMPEALGRIARLRELLPGTLVQVDGGITDGNVEAVREAGADLFVAGSAVFYPDDIVAAYRRLASAVA